MFERFKNSSMNGNPPRETAPAHVALCCYGLVMGRSGGPTKIKFVWLKKEYVGIKDKMWGLKIICGD